MGLRNLNYWWKMIKTDFDRAAALELRIAKLGFGLMLWDFEPLIDALRGVGPTGRRFKETLK
jgi:hypothetical protein